MVKLAPKANFGRQIIEWDNTIILIKEAGSFIVQPHLTKCEMQEVVIHTADPASTREDTVCLLVWSPWPHSLFIIGWWCSNPRTAAMWDNRLCPS